MSKNSANHSYFKAMTTLLSGSLIAQIVTIVCSPILTRICSPDELGLYTLVTGAVTMFGSVMSLRYELCIVSVDDKKTYPLIKLSFIICLLLSLLIFIGYLIYFYVINVAESPILLALLTALLCFVFGIINIVTSWNNRNQQYKLITRTYAMRVIAQNVLNVGAGFLGWGAVGLSFSHLVGYNIGVYGQSKELLRDRKKIFAVKKSEIYDVMNECRKQAVFSAPAVFANGLSYSLINYFIEWLYSTSVVGFYSISYRILGLPITIISSNVSRVFFAKAANEYKEKGNFFSTYKITVLPMIIIGISVGALMIIFAPWACEFFFGDGWGVAGQYVSILTPMFILRFIAGGVNCSAIIVNRQDIDLIIQILLTVGLAIIFIISLNINLTIEVFLMCINIVFSIIYIIYIVLFGLCAKGILKSKK